MKIKPKKRDYAPWTIFTYSTEHLLKKDKVRFYYALKGRDGRTGIVNRYDVEQLGRAVLLIPNKHAKDVEGFLNYWKCNYKSKDILIEGKDKPKLKKSKK